MAEIMDMVAQLSQGDALKKLGGQLGIDPDTLNRGMATAMPLLVSALANQASTPDGAQALHGALARDHDGSSIKNTATALANADTDDGGRILGHVLGDRQDAAQQTIAKATGMDGAAAGKLLATLAPVVMGALGHMQQQHGLDAQGLSDRLDQEVEKARQVHPGLMDMATRLLDRNQDGSIVDDVSGFVGKLFEKR
jgi:hypothetical protein